MFKICQITLLFAKALSLSFRRKKKFSTYLPPTPNFLLPTYGRCPALLKSKSSLQWQHFRGPQSIPASTWTVSCHHSSSCMPSVCHFASVFFQSSRGTQSIHSIPCFRIFPLDQEWAYYSLWTKSSPVAWFFQIKCHWNAAILICSYSVWLLSTHCNWVVVTENAWPAKPKISTIWAFYRRNLLTHELCQ